MSVAAGDDFIILRRVTPLPSTSDTGNHRLRERVAHTSRIVAVSVANQIRVGELMDQVRSTERDTAPHRGINSRAAVDRIRPDLRQVIPPSLVHHPARIHTPR